MMALIEARPSSLEIATDLGSNDLRQVRVLRNRLDFVFPQLAQGDAVCKRQHPGLLAALLNQSASAGFDVDQA
jgi:hypothetical protein